MAGTRQGKQPPKTGTGRPRRPRDSLSREAILEAAEKVALRDGLEGLTFQAIGAELDAHPTSMYRHFRDKDELLLELVDGLRSRSYGGTMVPTDDWRADLRTIAQRVREHYARYAPFAQKMVMRTTRRPAEFANVEFSLDALRRAGLDGEEAVVVQRAFGNFVRAMASLEASFQALEPEVRKKDELAWQVEYRQLDPERYPAIAAHADLLPNVGSPVAFDTGLELLIEAIEQRVAKSRQRKGIGEGVEQPGDQERPAAE